MHILMLSFVRLFGLSNTLVVILQKVMTSQLLGLILMMRLPNTAKASTLAYTKLLLVCLSAGNIG